MPKVSTLEIVKTEWEIRRVRFKLGKDIIPGSTVTSVVVTPSSGDINVISSTPAGEDVIVLFSGGFIAQSPYTISLLALMSNGEKVQLDGIVHVVAQTLALEESLKTIAEERLLDFVFADKMFPEEGEVIDSAVIDAINPTGGFNVTGDIFFGVIAQGEARAGLVATYTVRARVTTSLGQQLEGFGKVKVVS